MLYVDSKQLAWKIVRSIVFYGCAIAGVLTAAMAVSPRFHWSGGEMVALGFVTTVFAMIGLLGFLAGDVVDVGHEVTLDVSPTLGRNPIGEVAARPDVPSMSIDGVTKLPARLRRGDRIRVIARDRGGRRCEWIAEFLYVDVDTATGLNRASVDAHSALSLPLLHLHEVWLCIVSVVVDNGHGEAGKIVALSAGSIEHVERVA